MDWEEAGSYKAEKWSCQKLQLLEWSLKAKTQIQMPRFGEKTNMFDIYFLD